MKIENAALLLSFRTPGPCEYCRQKCKLREAHHCHTRGAGQLDIACNLIRLGATRPFPQCPCHGNAHAGKLNRSAFLPVIAAREKMLVTEIVDIIHCFRRLPKQPRRDEIEQEIADLSQRAREIVTGELQRLEMWP